MREVRSSWESRAAQAPASPRCGRHDSEVYRGTAGLTALWVPEVIR